MRGWQSLRNLISIPEQINRLNVRGSNKPGREAASDAIGLSEHCSANQVTHAQGHGRRSNQFSRDAAARCQFSRQRALTERRVGGSVREGEMQRVLPSQRIILALFVSLCSLAEGQYNFHWPDEFEDNEGGYIPQPSFREYFPRLYEQGLLSIGHLRTPFGYSYV